MLSQRIEENYGRIDVPKLIEIIKRPAAMQSNLHDAVLAPETLEMWFADAGRTTPACDEPYAHVSLPAWSSSTWGTWRCPGVTIFDSMKGNAVSCRHRKLPWPTASPFQPDEVSWAVKRCPSGATCCIGIGYNGNIVRLSVCDEFLADQSSLGK